MSERQEALNAYNAWAEAYKPGEFIEYSHETYEHLTKEADARRIWTKHGTCEVARFSNGIREFSGDGCGCWWTYGWVVCAEPWEGDDDTLRTVDTELYCPCETCNEDGSDENVSETCPQCEGDGYFQVYFDNYFV